MKFELISRIDGFCTVHAYDTLVVTKYTRAAAAETINQMTVTLQRIAAERGQVSTITIAPSRILSIDEATRAAAAHQREVMRDSLLANAIIIPTGTLAGPLVHLIITGLAALRAHGTPVKTFSSTVAALAWLQSIPGQSLAVRGLHATDLPLEEKDSR